MLSRSEILEALDYNRDTGVFTWKIAPCRAVRAGSIAGTVDNRGFIEIGFKGNLYKAHRLAWFLETGEWPSGRLVHRNQDRADNRIGNLRGRRTVLTAQTLREELEYNPDTGKFYRLRGNSAAGISVGDEAGYIDDGYVEIFVAGSYHKAHRLAWLYQTGSWPKNEIDHRDTVRSNNAWENLREASRSQNRFNVSKPLSNTSGWKGVSWHKGQKKWVARIGMNGKRVSLGYFDNIKEAAEEYMFAALEHHGEFARLE